MLGRSVQFGLLFFFLGLLGMATQMNDDKQWEKKRSAMVETIHRYGLKDKHILAAMGRVRRHLYIPEDKCRSVDLYGDHPCSIGYGQTISQPFIVAYMTEQLKLKDGEKVLEIGSGSGYQAAVLAELGVKVFSVEIVPELAEHAQKILKAEGYENVDLLAGDGYKGWPEHAPFDAIIVTCAPEEVPQALVDQLRDGGRVIVPVGVGVQKLVLLRKVNGKIHREDDIAVRFVPMVKEK